MDYKQQIEKMAITYNKNTDKVVSDDRDYESIYDKEIPEDVDWNSISSDMNNFLDTHPNRQQFIEESNYNESRNRVKDPNVKSDKYTKRGLMIGGLTPIAATAIYGAAIGKGTKGKILGGITGGLHGAMLAPTGMILGGVRGSKKDSRLDEEYKNKNFGKSKYDAYNAMTNDLESYLSNKYNTDKEANMDYKQLIEKMAISYDKNTNKLESDYNDFDSIDWSNYSGDMSDSEWDSISSDMNNFLNTHPMKQEFINEHNYNSARDKVRNPNIKPNKYTKREALIGGLAPVAFGATKGALKGKDTKSKILGGITGAIKGAPLGLVMSTIGALSGGAKDSRLDEEYKNKNFGRTKYDTYDQVNYDLHKYVAGRNYGSNTDKEANMNYKQQIEKIAADEGKPLSSRDKETETRFWRDRFNPELKRNLISLGTTVAPLAIHSHMNGKLPGMKPVLGASIGALGINGALRAHDMNKLSKKYTGEKATLKQHALSQAGGALGMSLNATPVLGVAASLSTTPEAMIQKKRRMIDTENNQNNKEASMDFNQQLEKIAKTRYMKYLESANGDNELAKRALKLGINPDTIFSSTDPKRVVKNAFKPGTDKLSVIREVNELANDLSSDKSLTSRNVKAMKQQVKSSFHMHNGNPFKKLKQTQAESSFKGLASIPIIQQTALPNNRMKKALNILGKGAETGLAVGLTAAIASKMYKKKKKQLSKDDEFTNTKEANMDYNQQIEKIAKSRYMKYLEEGGSDEEITRRLKKLGVNANTVNSTTNANDARRAIKNTFNPGVDQISRLGKINEIARNNGPLMKGDTTQLKNNIKNNFHLHNGSPFKKLRETEAKVLSNKQNLNTLKNFGKGVAGAAAIGVAGGLAVNGALRAYDANKLRNNNNINNKEANMDYIELIEKMAADETNEGKPLSSRDMETKTRFWRDRLGPELKRGLITTGAVGIPLSIKMSKAFKSGEYPSMKSMIGYSVASSALQSGLRAHDLNKLNKKYTGEKATLNDHALSQGGMIGGSALMSAPGLQLVGAAANLATTPESIIQRKRRMLESEKEQTKTANDYMNYIEKIAANGDKPLSSRDQETETRFWRDRFGPEFRRGLITAGAIGIPAAAYSAKAVKNGKSPVSKKLMIAQAAGALGVNGALRAYDTNKLSKKYTGEKATLKDHALTQGGAVAGSALGKIPALYGLGGLAGSVANFSTTPEAVIQRKRRMLESEE